MGGVILRCTAKLLHLLDQKPSALASPEPGDDWYANLLWLDRRKCLLLVHAGTLFPVFAADVRKADLRPVGPAIVGMIQREIRAEGLPLDTFGDLDAAPITLAKTASRTVLGYMNETARVCELEVIKRRGLAWTDVAGLNRDLRRFLHLSRQPPGYIVPIERVQARLTLGYL